MAGLRTSISTALYGRDVWEHYRPRRPPNDVVQGWNGEHPVFTSLLPTLPTGIVIDVGVWKGQSTIFLADALRATRHDACVIAVDTFLGSSEHWGDRSLFEVSFGMPDLYQTFLENVYYRRAADLVVPLPQTSMAAAKILALRGVEAGLIHIDASHEYEDVLRDCQSYWPLLAPGGYIVGDDYHPTWPDVVKAADDFALSIGQPLTAETPKWIVRKPPE